MLKSKIRLLSLLFLTLFAASPARAGFLEEYPDLKKYLYREPESNLYLGLGVSPISILKSSVYFAANVFQVHWMTSRLDIEFFSASFGTTIGKDDFANARHFTFRTVPKFRINEYLSVGPLLGYEFVSFSNLNSRLYKGEFFTPFEPFSSKGWIYGVAVNQTFRYGKDYILKIGEMFYQETYPTDHTTEGWNYFYEREDLRADPSPIKGSTVFMIEISLLY